MQLVIDIPEGLKDVFKNRNVTVLDVDEMRIAIKNGTILPEGHGRLIDADELKKEYPHDTDWDYPVNTNCCVVESIDNSPTIIDAESEGTDADSD